MQVRVVEFTAATPFAEQLRTMAETGLFISVHTSNLANAQFLPPGAAVVEIIQRNWVWHNLDRSFQVRPNLDGSAGPVGPLQLLAQHAGGARRGQG